MVLYEFRCDSGCGVTKQMYSMHARPDVIDCPNCRGSARRTIAAPNLGRGGGTAMALQDATRATADRPAVVAGPPPAGRRQKVTTNPLHQKLPRP
ncbi:putative FmdB family regulatory protein [Mycobacterium frederiksbergense]|uniref:FmdB family regulatory protein n=1 Tax=Mycolicibacterium frederiksbergense TaxID=117567 RepID=A0ABT6KW27_9MYCO|nr:zinc ribbon domain-containing protein [Mycolicibacterium frederiksbergense]MDH6194917.1 putative FmdB family regulatory protein [Mycolicibacterium frederiksbergense]